MSFSLKCTNRCVLWSFACCISPVVCLLSVPSLVRSWYSRLAWRPKVHYHRLHAEPGESKGRYTLSVKLSDFTVWRHTWRKNWVNCAVLTGSSAGLRTVLSSRLSHRELRSSLRGSHSFLSLPADTTMSSSQGTQPSKINKREATFAFIETYRLLHEILLFGWHYGRCG